MKASEDFWDDLFSRLNSGTLLPVVGAELVTVKDGDRCAPLYRLLGERLAERYDLNVDWTPRASLDDAARAYVVKHGRSNADRRLYGRIADLLSDLNPQPPECLRQLAQISDLSLFVSTTFDHVLAAAVNDVRFAGAARTRELWFAPNQSTDDQQRNASRPAADEVVVFQLFGEASSTPQYAVHEEDVLEWLHALLTESARLPEWLNQRIRGDALLFIGVPLSDWVGRVLTRLASDHRLSRTTKQYFIVSQDLGRSPSLVEFFSTFCGESLVQVLEADPAEFVAELHARWAKRARQAKPLAAPQRADSLPPATADETIFISYAREDADAVDRLAESIQAAHGNVWLDRRRLDPGVRWEDEILSTIRGQVRLFVPVISRNTEIKEKGQVFTEWREAIERNKCFARGDFIVPVVIDGDFDGNPARYDVAFRMFRDFNFVSAPHGRLAPSDADRVVRAARRREVR
jgi:hypothetical protein